MKYNDEAVEKLIGNLVSNNFCPSDIDLKDITDHANGDYNVSCEKCWKQALRGVEDKNENM